MRPKLVGSLWGLDVHTEVLGCDQVTARRSSLQGVTDIALDGRHDQAYGEQSATQLQGTEYPCLVVSSP
jgi:hypothetical protein